MSNDELQEMIEEADRDGDGAINEEEFIRIMKKTNLFGWYNWYFIQNISFLNFWICEK